MNELQRNRAKKGEYREKAGGGTNEYKVIRKLIIKYICYINKFNINSKYDFNMFEMIWNFL